MAFQDALYLLDQMGFTDVFLPFILIFTIIFAVLQKIELFGENKSRKFNSIISLALSIGVIIPHSLNKYPPGTDVVQILNTALPNVSLFIVAIVFLLVVIGMFGGKAEWKNTWAGGVVTFIAVAVLIFIFGNAAGWWVSSGVYYWLSDPNIQAMLIVLIVFWLIVSAITKGEGEEGSAEKFGKFFGAAAQAAQQAENKGKGGAGG